MSVCAIAVETVIEQKQQASRTSRLMDIGCSSSLTFIFGVKKQSAERHSISVINLRLHQYS